MPVDAMPVDSITPLPCFFAQCLFQSKTRNSRSIRSIATFTISLALPWMMELTDWRSAWAFNPVTGLYRPGK